MIHLTIENDMGSIVMGGHAGDTWRIRAIDGLGPVATEATTVQYVGVPGQTTLEVLPQARTITITADLNTREREQRQWRLTQAMRVLNTTEEVTLRINFNGKMRKIVCRPQPASISHFNAAAQELTISLVCDNPYFRDVEESSVLLSARVDNLQKGMAFPRVFTYRYTKGTVINAGDAKVEPIIKISTGALVAESDTVLLVNETTGAEIRLNYRLKSYETITVDIENRRIKSSRNGNILYCKDPGTVLRKFVLQKGKNIVRFGDDGGTQPVTAQLLFRNLYTEAVY